MYLVSRGAREPGRRWGASASLRKLHHDLDAICWYENRAVGGLTIDLDHPTFDVTGPSYPVMKLRNIVDFDLYNG